MSEENVERFTEMVGAFNRIAETAEMDLVGLRRVLENIDPGVQFEPQQAALEGGYVGHEGVIQWMADLNEHYAGGHIEFPDIRDLEDRVLAIGTIRVIGRGSGIETDAPMAVLARFENGLITQFKDYGDERQALEAAGLSE
jgi:ketosteroid isomerase-like protein